MSAIKTFFILCVAAVIIFSTSCSKKEVSNAEILKAARNSYIEIKDDISELSVPGARLVDGVTYKLQSHNANGTDTYAVSGALVRPYLIFNHDGRKYLLACYVYSKSSLRHMAVSMIVFRSDGSICKIIRGYRPRTFYLKGQTVYMMYPRPTNDPGYAAERVDTETELLKLDELEDGILYFRMDYPWGDVTDAEEPETEKQKESAASDKNLQDDN